jgi:hypothetical protein
MELKYLNKLAAKPILALPSSNKAISDPRPIAMALIPLDQNP